jgi:hypothetical protein
VPHEPGDQHGHARETRRRRSNHAKHQQRFDWQVGEAEYAVERVAQPVRNCPSAPPFEAGAPFIRYERAAESKPEEKRDQIGVHFSQLEQPVAHLPVAAEHINPAARHVFQDEPAVQSPEPLGCGLRQQSISAAGTMAEDHVGFAVLQQPVELEYEFGRLLHIGRDRGEIRTSPESKPCGNRRERPKVSTQLDQAGANGPCGKSLPQDLKRRVRTAIDNEHNFQRVRHSRGEGVQFAKQSRKVRFVLVDGYHQGQHRWSGL